MDGIDVLIDEDVEEPADIAEPAVVAGQDVHLHRQDDIMRLTRRRCGSLLPQALAAVPAGWEFRNVRRKIGNIVGKEQATAEARMNEAAAVQDAWNSKLLRVGDQLLGVVEHAAVAPVGQHANAWTARLCSSRFRDFVFHGAELEACVESLCRRDGWCVVLIEAWAGQVVERYL